jgi:hypothetical protein
LKEGRIGGFHPLSDPLKEAKFTDLPEVHRIPLYETKFESRQSN